MTLSNKTELVRDIHARWAAIQSKARTIPVPLPKALELLGSSRKVAKSEEAFPLIRSRILYLAPAYEAFPDGAEDGRTLCPWATTCIAPCLGHNSGQLALPASARARIWKTTLFLGDRKAFRALLGYELEAFRASCDRKGLLGAVRLDGASDTGEAGRWAERFPSLAFYDYTKSYARARTYNIPRHPENWSLCYSFDGKASSRRKARKVLEAGGTVSVVFDSLPARKDREAGPLPLEWEGFPVFDGDAHDFLPADPGGAVRGLRFKAQRDRTGSLEAAGPFVERMGARA